VRWHAAQGVRIPRRHLQRVGVLSHRFASRIRIRIRIKLGLRIRRRIIHFVIVDDLDGIERRLIRRLDLVELITRF